MLARLMFFSGIYDCLGVVGPGMDTGRVFMLVMGLVMDAVVELMGRYIIDVTDCNYGGGNQ